MGERTSISWTHHTFNPWWGCTEVSPACDHCYARAWALRTGFADLWGPSSQRRFFSDAHWNEPLKWNKRAAAAGERRRVFCASMADVFDNHEGVIDARSRLWYLIRETPHLDWLLLTKRIGNAQDMLPIDWGEGGYRNVWLGITVANQEEADRDIPKLVNTPARVHFLSCEPLLGPIDLGRSFACGYYCDEGGVGHIDHPFWSRRRAPIDWVIAGSESGRGARPCDLAWVRELRDQCALASVAFHWKQHVVDGIKTHTPELDGRRWVEFPRSAA